MRRASKRVAAEAACAEANARVSNSRISTVQTRRLTLTPRLTVISSVNDTGVPTTRSFTSGISMIFVPSFALFHATRPAFSV